MHEKLKFEQDAIYIYYRVRTGHGNLEKSWNSEIKIPGLEKSWNIEILPKVMERSWNLK